MQIKDLPAFCEQLYIHSLEPRTRIIANRAAVDLLSLLIHRPARASAAFAMRRSAFEMRLRCECATTARAGLKKRDYSRMHAKLEARLLQIRLKSLAS